jgi:hypothetical protein
MIRNWVVAGVLGALTFSANGAVVVIDAFEGSEGHFTSASNASGSSAGFVAASTTIVLDPTTGQNSSSSQKLTIDDDVAVNVVTDNWRFRNLSGGGTIANNLSFDSTGFVGYWAKTTTPNLMASILIDDSSTITERGRFQPMIADGEWHAYEWNLDAAVANTEWFGFAGTGNNGLIDGVQVSIDSTYTTAPFIGGVAGETDAVFNIDNVSINPTGSITAVPEPVSLGLLFPAAVGVLARRRR